MVGWRNPLPIGQSIPDPGRKQYGALVGRRKMVLPVAIAGRGHSSKDFGPCTSHDLYHPSPFPVPLTTTLPTATARVLHQLQLALFISHPPPRQDPGALIASLGHIGGNTPHGKRCGNVTNTTNRRNAVPLQKLGWIDGFLLAFLLGHFLSLSSLVVYLKLYYTALENWWYIDSFRLFISCSVKSERV